MMSMPPAGKTRTIKQFQRTSASKEYFDYSKGDIQTKLLIFRVILTAAIRVIRANYRSRPTVAVIASTTKPNFIARSGLLSAGCGSVFDRMTILGRIITTIELYE
jgi:hypothetical protein